jgi:hypothetical protein
MAQPAAHDQGHRDGDRSEHDAEQRSAGKEVLERHERGEARWSLRRRLSPAGAQARIVTL